MKTLFFSLFTLLFTSAAFAQDTGKSHRIVFSFTSNDTMQMKAFLNQLSNVREEWPEAEIEVVAYNFGLDLMLKENNRFSAKVQSLHAKGIRFIACENTMNRRNIYHEQILPVAGFVKAGITEIVLKQEAGWSYIVGGF